VVLQVAMTAVWMLYCGFCYVFKTAFRRLHCLWLVMDRHLLTRQTYVPSAMCSLVWKNHPNATNLLCHRRETMPLSEKYLTDTLLVNEYRDMGQVVKFSF